MPTFHNKRLVNPPSYKWESRRLNPAVSYSGAASITSMVTLRSCLIRSSFASSIGELSILHQISIDRCRRLKVTKPCGLFECSLVDLIIVDRASHNLKAHMKGIEFETFSESSRGRSMHCCNDRFLFHYVRRRKYQNLFLRARQIIFFIAIELPGTIIQSTSPILFSTD